MKILIEIRMGNDTLLTADDLAQVLRETAERIAGDKPSNMTIHDTNGNRVGELQVVTWPGN